jgi:hypothetical protein
MVSEINLRKIRHMKQTIYLVVKVCFIWIISCELIGCELFTTRAVEPPSGSTGEGWILPLNPRAVIDNMGNAIERRSDVDYLKSLASDEVGLEPFKFHADPQTLVNYPNLFNEWSISQETNFAQSLFSPSTLPLDSMATVNFNIEQETVLGDSASLGAQYNLHLGHVRDSAPRQIEGWLDFYLLRGDDGGWYIQRWHDVRIGGQPCWSDLKAQF